MALHVLAYNLTRVINIVGSRSLIAAIRTYRRGPARILSPSRPRRRETAPGALPGRDAAKLGELTKHRRPTAIVTPSTLPPERFHTTKTQSCHDCFQFLN
jgi:hypothetical protein